MKKVIIGALICVLALSIGIEGKRGKLSRPNWREAIQTLLTTKDVWFDAFRRSSFPASANGFTTITYDDFRGGTTIDISTGVFTAPYTGVYEFFFQGTGGSGKTSKHVDSMRLLVNFEVVSVSISAPGYGYGGADNLFGTAIVNVLAGQQVLVQTYNTIFSTKGSPGIHFTGKLLSM